LNWLEERTMPLAEVSARASREISLLREYRTHLIADVVTGKLDVREAAARLSDEAHPAGTDLDEGLIEDGAGIDGQGGEVDSEDVAA
jgi:type I restriction enzyme S subunit